MNTCSLDPVPGMSAATQARRLCGAGAKHGPTAIHSTSNAAETIGHPHSATSTWPESSLDALMSLLFHHLRVHQIFGANTDVGKTLLTSALVRASAVAGKAVYYLKPVSTGPLQDADDE